MLPLAERGTSVVSERRQGEEVLMIKGMMSVVACAFLATTAQAATTVSTLGTPVRVGGTAATDGQVLFGAELNGSTDPAPFDVLSGRDSSANFDAKWTQTYTPIIGTITGGSVQLGIFDVDGDIAGNQVGRFTLNGIDLTAALNAAVNAKTFTGDSRYGIYDVAFGADSFAALATGKLDFALALSGPARNVLGATSFNAGVLDYSTVSVTTGNLTPAVPEPATWAMMAGGFGVMGATLRRRRRATGTAAA